MNWNWRKIETTSGKVASTTGKVAAGAVIGWHLLRAASIGACLLSGQLEFLPLAFVL
jgi:hypothetical protein